VFGIHGHVDFDDDYEMDLKLTGDKPDFDLIIAFLPTDVATNLRRFENQGKIFFNGSIQGKAASGHTPFIEFSFGCENAWFLNTEADKRIDELTFMGYYTNGDERSMRTSEFHLTDFYAKPEEGIFRGNFVVRNFLDPYINMNLYSDLDLAFLGEFLGFEGLQRLRGNVIINMDFNELVDLSVPENQLVKLKEGIDSDLIIRNLSFTIPGYPYSISNMNVHAEMRSGRVELDSLSLRIGNSDFYMDGMLSDLPSIFHRQKEPIKVEMNLKSSSIVFSELLSYDKALAAKTNEEIKDFSIKVAFETSVDDLLNANPLPRGTFYINDFYASLKNYPHTFHDFDANIYICDTAVVLKGFDGEIDDTDFHFEGFLSNYRVWFDDIKRGETRFDFNLNSKQLKLQNLLSYNGENYLPEDYRDEVVKELNLHGEMLLHYDSALVSADLVIDNMAGLLKVHPLKLQNFKGTAQYKNQILKVADFGGRMGNSDFRINLDYYTGAKNEGIRLENNFEFVAAFLDLDELMNYNPNEDTIHEEAFNIFELPFSNTNISAKIDHLRYHKVILDDFNAKLRLKEDHFLFVDTIHTKVSGGNMAMNGYFNGSDPAKIYFKSSIKANEVDLDQLMFKFDNFGQDYMINDNLHGKLSGTINSTLVVHPDLTPILNDGEAEIDVNIKNGSIVNFAPILAMSDYFKDKNLSRVRFDTLSNKLTLKNGTLHIPNMNINSSIGFIELSGRQSLDLDMDYFIRVPLQMVTQVGFRTLFGGKNREQIDEDQEDAIQYRDENRRIRFLNLRVVGNPDDYKITLGKDKS
ncbi:MAG: AsmA-like C-terminal region-containing protein, partial [Cyclobacteriaceae bacterium]